MDPDSSLIWIHTVCKPVDSRKSKNTIADDKGDGLTVVNGSIGLILYVSQHFFSHVWMGLVVSSG